MVDCDNPRRKNRAEALMKRGALVDGAAETIAARVLWKHGAYDLVLIDLRGVDADCAAFISFVHRERATQRFGYYIDQPPYVTASASEARSLMKREVSRGSVGHRQQSTGINHAHNNLSMTARRIAAFRQGVRIRLGAQAAQESPDLAIREERLSVSVSDAMKLASRILGSF